MNNLNKITGKELPAPVDITFGSADGTNWVFLCNGDVYKVLYNDWINPKRWRKATENEKGKVIREYKAHLSNKDTLDSFFGFRKEVIENDITTSL